MKSLNRIEHNFIFQNFVKDRPTLRLISASANILKIPNTNYRIENNIIEFLPNVNLKVENYKLLFPHKGRLIFSDIEVQKKTMSFFFVFPNDLFLYKTENTKNTTAKLCLKINKKTDSKKNELFSPELNLRVLNDFPLFNFESDLLNKQENNSLLTNINLLLNYRNNKRGDEFCISRIYFFLQKLLEGSIIEFETSNASSFLSLIFLSERFLVLFLPENVFKLFSLSISTSLNIRVENRFISLQLEKPAGTMKFQKSAALDSNMVLVVVPISNITIEDKRFLYEKIYNTKYGKLI